MRKIAGKIREKFSKIPYMTEGYYIDFEGFFQFFK